MPNKSILWKKEREILADIDSRLTSDPRYNISLILKTLESKLPWLHEQFLDQRSRVNKKSMSVNKTLNFREFSGKFAHIVAYYGFDTLLKTLLDKDTDLNALDQDKNTLLHLAVLSGSIKTLNVLLEKDVSKNINTKNEYGETPLDLAYASGNSTTINTIIAMGGITSEALVAATEGTMEEMEVAEYTSRSIDVLRDQDGNTLLHLAAMSGDIQVIKALLAAGASVNAKNSDGLTPLPLAVISGNVEVVHVLVQAGADVSAKDQQDNTPLHLASVGGNLEVVNALGADVSINVQDQNGNTPLHLAVVGGNLRVVNLLLQAGANISAENKDGQTPLDLAYASGNSTTINTIIAMGGITSEAEALALAAATEEVMEEVMEEGVVAAIEDIIKGGVIEVSEKEAEEAVFNLTGVNIINVTAAQTVHL